MARTDRDQQGFNGGRSSSDNPGGNSGGGTRGGGQLASRLKQTETKQYDKGALSNVGAGPTGTNALGGATSSTGKQPGRSDGAGDSDVTDKTGRLVSEGTVPNVPNASLGQKIGLFAGLLPGGMLNSLPDLEDAVENPGAPPKGGVVGRGIDAMTGETPGAIEGSVPNRVASSDHTRGARPSDGGNADGLQDSASVGDADPDLTGAAATDYLFSDVQLDDRRKYKPVGAGTAMAMGLG